ncbi:MAG: transposase [Candidatus Thiodiazotropha sp. (ex Semelilucina semeliformis)]|nr:transposase [Candidatus Thiodiazotropha sp. (ex Semelilucina semeliformis)]
MAKILSSERVVEYTTEFKVKVVALTNHLDVDAVTIAGVLGLHPVMVYRWRQEHREGQLVEQPSRRISMTKPSSSKSDEKELKDLRKQVKKLQKENDFLKKWEEYLKAQKQKDLDL